MKQPIETILSDTYDLVHHTKVVDRLRRSELFQSYQAVFQDLTGLPLGLHAMADERVSICRGSVNQNRFCRLLNGGEKGCRECLLAQRCLAEGKGRSVQSISCFAGLKETAIPIVVGSVVVAQLKTGQVFHEAPTPEDFARVAGVLGSVDASKDELEQAFLATPVRKQEKYHAMVTLLAAFSLQLTKLANQIALEEECREDGVIGVAKDFIEENLVDPIHLDEVAKVVNMSPFHFCRKFKNSTGVTLTNYVAQRRVELAKNSLKTTTRRVTEIAFASGFQSLSQFNRSFRRAVGMSPSKYRKTVTEQRAPLVSLRSQPNEEGRRKRSVRVSRAGRLDRQNRAGAVVNEPLCIGAQK